ELDGCVLPSPACEAPRDVVTLNADGQKLSFAVETIRLLATARASSGSVLSEMKLRPLTAHGPKELLSQLTPGAHLRVRALLRIAERYLILQSVEPRPAPKP